MSITTTNGHLDLVLVGGTVVDGTGGARYQADVGLVGDAIAEIGDLGDRVATRRVDVTGRIVAPGFIDALHNADMAVLLDPAVEMATAQGVTTALVGCCGVSMAPVSAAHRADVRHHAFFKTGRHDFEWDWLTVADYLDRVDGASAINVAALFGFDNLWFAVRGFDASPPSRKDIDAMRGLAAESMDQGAVGMSHGAGAASLWSNYDQVTEVAKGLASRRGVFACHQQAFGLEDPFSWIRRGAMVAIEAGIPMHFLHFKSTSARTHGREEEMLRIVEELRQDEDEITLGSYPYSSGGGGVRVPAWAEEGGTSEMLARLADPPTRARIVEELDELWGWDPHLTAIANPDNQWMEGRHLYEIARQEQTTPGEIMCRLVESDFGTQHVIGDHGGGDGLEVIMRHENHIACSDAIYAGEHPHPRCFGAYPRYLGHHVRELRTFTLEECIRQMTSSPATMMGLADRGTVQAGKKADLVVFDEETVGDRTSEDTPLARATGIEMVLVNGEVVREADAPTGATPGRAVRPAKR
jgi:N-acyl-D-amino-acid deacylase